MEGGEAPRGRGRVGRGVEGARRSGTNARSPRPRSRRALASRLRRSSRSGGASRRWKAPMRIILKISPGRGATHGDREPCEALDAELACLFARTYLVATARARRTVRRPRRDAAEGLSAALDSEMAAMTARMLYRLRARDRLGGTGASAGNALDWRGVGNVMRPAETSCRSRRVRTSRGTEPNERTRREERPLARGGVLARRALRGRRRNLEASADFCPSSKIFFRSHLKRQISEGLAAKKSSGDARGRPLVESEKLARTNFSRQNTTNGFEKASADAQTHAPSFPE